jgi:hypothetical protein
MDRDEAIKRIRTALKARSGKTWSVTGGRGTAWGWITVQAPPARRVLHEANPNYDCSYTTPGKLPYLDVKPGDGEQGYYTSISECKELAELFGLGRPVHSQGISISPDDRDWYVTRAERGREA